MDPSQVLAKKLPPQLAYLASGNNNASLLQRRVVKMNELLFITPTLKETVAQIQKAQLLQTECESRFVISIRA
ncbi:hypothetical protein Y1Q_0019073 [Alligator mississippiensis]|uniref:Uncharacterized protein n=1 Tax=Alligator mississippiensis TaxID=8496 RepID=A0A151N1B7_ALLMI|nr:hypothetical protein Y1Q_0019073 [Alligator mississippiensis]